MIQICIALIGILALLAMSLRANRQFRNTACLPMQWSLSGSVNWTAPRRVALALMPILGGTTIVIATIATLFSTPRPGQEALVPLVILFLSIVFVAVHALHIGLIAKTLRMTGD